MPAKTGILWTIRLYCALAAVWVGWGWFAYAGPFRWAAEWQVRQFGSYYEKWTVLLPLLLLILPAVVVAQRFGVADQLFGARTVPGQPARRWAKTLALIALAPLAVCAAAGIWYTAPHAPPTSGTLDLVTGQELPPSTELVSITGLRQPRFAFALTTTQSVDDRHTYVPLTGPRWTQRDPVRYFIESTDGPGEGTFDTAQDIVTLDGAALERNGLPGVIRERFQATLTLADPAWVVHPEAAVGDTPLIVAGVAGLVAAVLLLAAAMMAVIEQIRSPSA